MSKRKVWTVDYRGDVQETTAHYETDKYVVVGDNIQLRVVNSCECHNTFEKAAAEAVKKLSAEQFSCNKRIADLITQMVSKKTSEGD